MCVLFHTYNTFIFGAYCIDVLLYYKPDKCVSVCMIEMFTVLNCELCLVCLSVPSLNESIMFLIQF